MPILDRKKSRESTFIDIVQLRREPNIVLFKGNTCPIAVTPTDGIASGIFAVNFYVLRHLLQ